MFGNLIKNFNKSELLKLFTKMMVSKFYFAYVDQNNYTKKIEDSFDRKE